MRAFAARLAAHEKEAAWRAYMAQMAHYANKALYAAGGVEFSVPSWMEMTKKTVKEKTPSAQEIIDDLVKQLRGRKGGTDDGLV